MKIFIYKNGLCDPEKKVGAIKQFNNAKDVDDFLKALCFNMNTTFLWEIIMDLI